MNRGAYRLAPTIAELKELAPGDDYRIFRVEQRGDQFLALPKGYEALIGVWGKCGVTLHERLFDRPSQPMRLYIDLDCESGTSDWSAVMRRGKGGVSGFDLALTSLVDYLRSVCGTTYVWDACSSKKFSVHIMCPNFGASKVSKMRTFVSELAGSGHLHNMPERIFDMGVYGRGKSLRCPYSGKPTPDGSVVRRLLPHAMSDPIPDDPSALVIWHEYETNLDTLLLGYESDSSDSEASGPDDAPEDVPDEAWHWAAEYLEEHYQLLLGSRASRDGYYRAHSSGSWDCDICGGGYGYVTHDKDNGSVRLFKSGFALTCYRACDNGLDKKSKFIRYHRS